MLTYTGTIFYFFFISLMSVKTFRSLAVGISSIESLRAYRCRSCAVYPASDRYVFTDAGPVLFIRHWTDTFYPVLGQHWLTVLQRCRSYIGNVSVRRWNSIGLMMVMCWFADVGIPVLGRYETDTFCRYRYSLW